MEETVPDTIDGDETYYLEQVTLDDEEEDDYQYTEVEVDEDLEEDLIGGDVDEDLEQALKTLKSKETGATAPKEELASRSAVTRRPEVLDDFIRNVLLKLGMVETLDMFQREWYRLSGEGKLSDVDMGTVPDIYVRNQQLGDSLKNMQTELEKMQEVATAAKSTWDKFRKERDFHKMHHKRVVQEKNKLIVDIKRLKTHYENYEPMLKMMRAKYETAMKEKMLMKLERDRLATKVGALEAQLHQLEASGKVDAAGADVSPPTKKVVRVAKLPDDRENPYLSMQIEVPGVDRWGLSKTFPSHTMSVAAVAMHPTKPIVATASDDCSWKMWNLPGGELIMSGDGHKEWLSSIDFSPQGTSLATGSADCTVKIWDFSNSQCVASLAEHTMAVWSVAYHDTGDFVASASMDHTAKLWDLLAGKCRTTLRGHVDSVNSTCFQPFSNNLCTGSGDKTVSLWDCRSGLCVQSLYGHKNAVNSVAFTLQGHQIASGDADGVVRVWDVRMVQEVSCVSAGPHPCNSVAFDPSGQRLAAGSDDGQVRVFALDASKGEMALLQPMQGHSDAVQCCAFDRKGKFMVTGGSDATLRIWC